MRCQYGKGVSHLEDLWLDSEEDSEVIWILKDPFKLPSLKLNPDLMKELLNQHGSLVHNERHKELAELVHNLLVIVDIDLLELCELLMLKLFEPYKFLRENKFGIPLKKAPELIDMLARDMANFNIGLGSMTEERPDRNPDIVAVLKESTSKVFHGLLIVVPPNPLLHLGCVAHRLLLNAKERWVLEKELPETRLTPTRNLPHLLRKVL